LSKKTVVVLDQASIHTSNAFLKKLEEWKQKKADERGLGGNPQDRARPRTGNILASNLLT
jgi:hypothetical protein